MTRRHLTILVLAVATTVPAAAQTGGNGRAVPVVRDAAATDFLPALHLVRPHAPPLDGVRELPRKILPGRVGSVAPDTVTETLVQDGAPVGVASVVEVGFDGIGNVNSVLPPDPTGAIG